MTFYDLLWSSMTFYDLLWPSMTFYDLQWPSMIKCLFSTLSNIRTSLTWVQNNSLWTPRLDSKSSYYLSVELSDRIVGTFCLIYYYCTISMIHQCCSFFFFKIWIYKNIFNISRVRKHPWDWWPRLHEGACRHHCEPGLQGSRPPRASGHLVKDEPGEVSQPENKSCIKLLFV